MTNEQMENIRQLRKTLEASAKQIKSLEKGMVIVKRKIDDSLKLCDHVFPDGTTGIVGDRQTGICRICGYKFELLKIREDTDDEN